MCTLLRAPPSANAFRLARRARIAVGAGAAPLHWARWACPRGSCSAKEQRAAACSESGEQSVRLPSSAPQRLPQEAERQRRPIPMQLIVAGGAAVGTHHYSVAAAQAHTSPLRPWYAQTSDGKHGRAFRTELPRVSGGVAMLLSLPAPQRPKTRNQTTMCTTRGAKGGMISPSPRRASAAQKSLTSRATRASSGMPRVSRTSAHTSAQFRRV